jgi:chemotaxis protein CheX
VDIKYIEPFINAANNAFMEMLRMEPTVEKPYLMAPEAIKEWNISGVIGIAGEARGVVVLSFYDEMAIGITERLTGKVIRNFTDDVVDAVGELVNIIAGNAKAGLEDYKLMISLPSIIQGEHHKIWWPTSKYPIIGIPFSTGMGRFHLSVGLENIITT